MRRGADPERWLIRRSPLQAQGLQPGHSGQSSTRSSFTPTPSSHHGPACYMAVDIRHTICGRLIRGADMAITTATDGRLTDLPKIYPPRSAVFSWMLFDWAAQPYFSLITTFVFAPYFATHVA